MGVLSLLTPSLLAALSRYSENIGSGWTKSLERVLLAGGPTPVWTMHRALELFEHTEFIVTLGQTEASFPITWHRVTKKDLKGGPQGRALVPLGGFTDYYDGSSVDEKSGEILLNGESIAPGKWEPSETGVGGHFEKLDRPHHTGDRALRENGLLHYLGRVSDPWATDSNLPAADAVEAVLNACPGVKRSRVDGLKRPTNTDAVAANVTVQPKGDSLDEDRIRSFFDEHKDEAKLSSVTLGRVVVDEVPVTLSGKVRRSGSGRSSPPVAGSDGSGAPPPGAGPCGSLCSKRWQDFDISRIATGPLYFYVGAGLSMGAGLVGWSEMACLIWMYEKYFEQKLNPCPCDKVEEIEKFLDDFVEEKVEESSSVRILSRAAEKFGSKGDPRSLGRAALLNMLFRYRGPRVFLEPQGDVVGRKQKEGRLVLRPRPGEEPSQEDLAVFSMIWRSGCHGVFTTNYDMLLEHAFSLYHHGAALRSYRYRADFLRFILSNPRFVLKLHGDINDIRTMELCPRKAWAEGGLSETGGRGKDLQRVYEAALNRGHMIYLGCGFRDETIRRLHDYWRPKNEGTLTRIALIPKWQLESQESAAEIRCTQGQGIELLSIEEYSEVKDFVAEVVSVRADDRERWGSCPEATDIYRKLFLSMAPNESWRTFSTAPWTCKGEVPPR